MPLMNNLKRGVDIAKFKTDQLMRVNRVQGEIVDLRRDIQNLREQIATAVLQLHKQAALAHADLEEMCTTIDQFEERVAEKEAHIAAIKAEALPQTSTAAAPVVLCPHCHARIPAGAGFCTQCGGAVPQPESGMPSQPPGSARCLKCGSTLPTHAAFCINCGEPVSTPVTGVPAAPLAPTMKLAALPDASGKPSPPGPTTPPGASEWQCANCGFSVPLKIAFCTHCGMQATTTS